MLVSQMECIAGLSVAGEVCGPGGPHDSRTGVRRYTVHLLPVRDLDAPARIPLLPVRRHLFQQALPGSLIFAVGFL